MGTGVGGWGELNHSISSEKGQGDLLWLNLVLFINTFSLGKWGQSTPQYHGVTSSGYMG